MKICINYFVFKHFVRRILDLIEITQSISPAQENIVNELLTYLQALCLGFGKYFTKFKVSHLKIYLLN